MLAQSSLFIADTNSARDCAQVLTALAERAEKSAREHTTLKGVLRFRRPARNSARTPRGRTTLLASIRRGLLGFAGLASHSGRSFLPFRLALFRKKRSFQLHAPYPRRAYCQGETTPSKTQSIGKKAQCVKSDSQQAEENFAIKFPLAIGLPEPEKHTKGKSEAKWKTYNP